MSLSAVVLERMSDEEVAHGAVRAVEVEREATSEVLRYLKQVEKRMIYADRGFSSLHEYCVRELRYSDGAAFRRISAMRLLNEVPEAEKMVQDGRMSLTTLSSVQVFFEREKRWNRRKYTVDEKQKLLGAVCGKSKRAVEEHLVRLAPNVFPKEKERLISEAEMEIRFVADAELQKMLKRIRELTRRDQTGETYLELFKFLARMVLVRIDPEAKAARDRKRPEYQDRQELKKQAVAGDRSVSMDEKAGQGGVDGPAMWAGTSGGATSPEKRYIPAGIRKQVWLRDGGQCTFKDLLSGRRCESRAQLEVDHRIPFALGGAHELDNLRLVCPTHNRLYAVRAFGVEKMKGFIRSLEDRYGEDRYGPAG